MGIITKFSLCLLFFFTSVFFVKSIAQCRIVAKADKIKICEGEPVTLTSIGFCDNFFMNNDFNNGLLGSGWVGTTGVNLNNPCSPHPSNSAINYPANGRYFWTGSTRDALLRRFLQTQPFNVPSGAVIQFDMLWPLHSSLGSDSPCEGPDQPNEGVNVEYSINNGLNWLVLGQWRPGDNSIMDRNRGVWNTLTINVPQAAVSQSTSFRWIQYASNDVTYDHWGLDNIRISGPILQTTVKWSHGPTVFNPPVVYPSQTTTYIVTITNGLTSSSDSVTVIVNPKPIGNPLEKDTICAGYGVKIGKPANSGTRPYYYKWMPSNGLSDDKSESPIASPNSTTLYIRSIDDVNGCKALDSVIVIVNPSIQFDAGKDVLICSGEDITLGQNPIGGTPPFKYRWTPSTGLSSTSISQPAAKPTISTKYFVEIIDSKGCSIEDSVSITVKETPIVSFPDEYAICGGDSVTIGEKAINDNGTYSYLWTPSTRLNSTNKPSTIAKPFSTTLYKLKVTSDNGCFVEKNVLVKIEPIPNAVAGKDALLCFGDSIKIGGDAFCGVIPFKYEWTPVAGLSNPNISSPFAKPLVTTKYVVKVTDGINRNAYDTVLISVNPELVLKAGGQYGICSNDSALIGLEASGGTKPYIIEWTPTSGLSSPNDLKTYARPKSTTKYYLKLSDANNCTKMDSTIVEVYPLPFVFAGNDETVCAGSPVIIGSLATGGTPDFNYDWEPKINIDNPKIAKPTVKPVKTTDYVVTVTDKNGCKAYDTVKISITPIPTAIAGKDTAFCLGGSVIIGGPAYCGLEPYIYKWSPSDGLSAIDIAQPRATPKVTTTYKVVVTDALNRSDSAKVTITVYPLPEINNLKDVEICFGSSLQIGDTAVNGKQPYIYLWNPSTGLSSSTDAFVIANPTVTTKYKLSVIDDNGCTSSKDMTVFVNSNPKVELSSEANVCVGKPVKLGSKVTGGTPPYIYTWIPPDAYDNYQSDSPSITLNATSTVKLSVEDSKGCNSTAELKIEVLNTQASVSLPILESNPKTRDFHIPVYLTSESNLLKCDANEFSADIIMDATIFNPVSSTKGTFKKKLIDSCRWRVSIIVPAENTWASGKVLTELIGDVLLGERISTPLKFEKVIWKGVSAEPTFVNGELKLTGICLEGGERLVDYGVCKLVALSPNPADDDINVAVEINTPGQIEIELFNSIGLCVFKMNWISKVDRNNNINSDNRTINIPLSLPSGAYSVILRSIGGIDNKSLIIAR